MQILVFSDSHGSQRKMLDAIAREKPDLIVHLGDGGRDLDAIKKQFPHIPLTAVRGNCDIGTALPETTEFSVEGIRFFITHGHLFGVKSGTGRLLDEAIARGADVVMYGHTHRADLHKTENVTVFNPGSCGYPPRSCAQVTVSGEGSLSCKILEL